MHLKLASYTVWICENPLEDKINTKMTKESGACKGFWVLGLGFRA